MGRYLIKLHELNEKKTYIKKNIDDICKCVETLKKAKESVRWVSPSQKIFFNKYDEYVQNLDKIVAFLQSSFNVVDRYDSNYEEGYNKIESDFTKLEDELEEKWINYV